MKLIGGHIGGAKGFFSTINRDPRRHPVAEERWFRLRPGCVSAMKGLIMNRIVHLALKVEDLEKTTAFYQHVFGFREVETARTRDHISRHLTDGTLDFTLIKYDEGTQSKESQASGVGPCIHHFAIEVEDLQQAEQQIKSFGCEIISDPGVIPIKFRAPGGTIAELVPVGRYKQPQSQ